MAFRVPLLLALVLALPVASAGADGSATRAVRSASQTMSRLLRDEVRAGSAEEKRRAQRVTTELRGFLDADELARRALADHWDGLSKTNRVEYSKLLRSLIEANYVKGLRAKLDYQVAYTGERAQGDRVLVTTEIKTKRKGRPLTIAIDYVLRREGRGWRAVDVITDGVGLVENYRAQFNRIIDKEGFDGLLARMRRKLDSMK